jgi:hypothetical protein
MVRERRSGLPVLALAAWAGAFLGCSREPEVVPAAVLKFPVVLIAGASAAHTVSHRADVVANSKDLGTMRVERLSNLPDPDANDPPLVIDSSASVFAMENIEGEHGGLWMMANPTGMMPIRYQLVRHEPSGIAAARALIAACDYLGSDLDQDRGTLRSHRIRRAETMAEVMEIIDEPAPADEFLPE